ncbi:MAG: universal stress protein, partial [Solirubrobacteraceae bacterium]
IITGSRGFGVVRQVALGSVSSRLVERSPVPVLVVPRGGDRDPVAMALRPTATSQRRSQPSELHARGVGDGARHPGAGVGEHLGRER